MPKVGFTVGKFCPFHMGHYYFIEEAINRCDKLVVFLSHDKRFFDSLPEEIRYLLDPVNRYYDLCDAATELSKKHNKTIYVGSIDESDIPEYPNGWKEFIDLCLEEFAQWCAESTPDIVFSSEPSYDPYYKMYLPNTEHVIIEPNRETYPISGTEIRKKMLEIYNCAKCELEGKMYDGTFKRIYQGKEI